MKILTLFLLTLVISCTTMIISFNYISDNYIVPKDLLSAQQNLMNTANKLQNCNIRLIKTDFK